MIKKRFGIQSQKGIVSILVTMIMMVVITLVVVAYSQIIVREQRQTLDRQLSSQAFYAAESAINAVNKAIDMGADVTQITKSNCSVATASLPASVVPYASSIPSGTDLAVTCLTIDPTSYDLIYSSIPSNGAQNAHILTNGGPSIGKIEIAWQGDTGSPSFGPGNFTPAAGWAATAPVLRIDLVTVPPPGLINAANLYSATQVFFLYPTGAAVGTTNSVVGDTRGAIVNARCNLSNTPKACKATIIGVNGKDFYMRIRPLYRNADVVVTPRTVADGPILLTGGQITIDSTGRSVDVLKRINVRRPVDARFIAPGFAIDSTSPICKKISAIPAPAASSDPACGLTP